MQKHSLLSILSIILCHSFLAQEVIATNGNYSTSAQGSLSWTMGEVITETLSTVDGHFTQGFQQNYEDILAVSDIGLNGELRIFPNPFQQEINLSISDSSPDYLIQILDYQSKIVLEEQIYFAPGTNQITLNLSALSGGYYIVHLTTTDSQIVLPIVKLN